MRSPRSLSLLAVLILGSSGCARVADIVVLDKPPPRVSLKGYPLDIAFGDAPIVPEVDSGSTPLAEVAAQVFGPFDEFDDAPPPARQRVAPPPDPCPEPGPGTFAVEPISANVRRPVEQGVYLFKQKGEIHVQITGLADFKQPVEGMTSRRVFGLQMDGERSRFTVDQTIGRRRAELSYAVTPGESIGLSKLVRHQKGGPVTFEPLTPVTVFPLPVAENMEVTGLGFDPRTQTTMVVQGRVEKKEEVLGCDEVVHGWLVKGTWTLQSPRETVRYEMEYVVATQHGGLVVRDTFRFSETETDQVPTTYGYDITTGFGSIKPKPDPEAK